MSTPDYDAHEDFVETGKQLGNYLGKSKEQKADHEAVDAICWAVLRAGQVLEDLYVAWEKTGHKAELQAIYDEAVEQANNALQKVRVLRTLAIELHFKTE